MILFSTLLLCGFISCSQESAGDRSPFFQRCVAKCNVLSCSEDGYEFVDSFKQPVAQKLLQWSCDDECRYECMWKTVDAFQKSNWQVPQFHGKWPFIRFMGLQEPASVIFSVLNAYVNLKLIKVFRKNVRSDSPLYWLWHVFCVVLLNGWFWSTVFHARDSPLTEVMDYCSAFSIILMYFYCMVIRVLRNAPNSALTFVTIIFTAVFINHYNYLSGGSFDYGYNMFVNVSVGMVTITGWLLWCVWNRKRQPYVWKCAAFYMLASATTILEFVDRPPILWVFDFHSLWHLSSIPLMYFIYSFAIDDCNFLRKQAFQRLQSDHLKEE